MNISIILVVLAVGLILLPLSTKAEEVSNSTQDIINGENVTTSTVEYSFFINSDPPGDSCGGSLIADDLVLTAAHCCRNWKKPNGWKKNDNITIAPLFRDPKNEKNGQHVKAQIADAIVHPFYSDNAPNDFDFCLLKLKSPVQNAKKICLVKKPKSLPRIGSIFTVIGFGKTANNGKGSDQLKRASQKVVNCADIFPASEITENMFCATAPDSTTKNQAAPGYECQGDSGGPIFNQDGIQYGIVAFTIAGDCTLGGGYAFVESALDWIENVACKSYTIDGKDFSHYCDGRKNREKCWEPSKITGTNTPQNGLPMPPNRLR